MNLGDRPWQHNVVTIRLRFRFGTTVLSNVWHLGCSVGVPDEGAVLEVGRTIRDAWAVGYGGHVAPAKSQGSGVILEGGHAYFADPFGHLRGIGIDGLFFEFPVTPVVLPLPANVSVAIGANCLVAGHVGRGWQFFPWLRSDALDADDADLVSPGTLADIRDGYAGVAAAVASVLGPFDLRLAVYHRDGRFDSVSGSTVWWDAIAGYRIRRSGLSELRVRLPAHGRRLRWP